MAIVLIWPLLNVDDRLRQVLKKEAARSLGSAAEIQHVHLALNHLDVLGLEVSDRQNRWVFTVSKATIRFNPLNLFRFGFNTNGLLATISSVDLTVPQITMRIPKKDSLPDPADTVRFNGWKILDNLPEALLISQVQMKAGIFHLQDDQGNPLITLGGLDIGLFSPQPGIFNGYLSSSALGVKKMNSRMDLSVNRRARTLEANFYAVIDLLRLGSEIGLKDSMSFRLDSLDVALRLWALDTRTGLSGEVSLQRLALNKSERELLYTEQLRLILGDWNLLIPHAEVHGLTANWQLRGQIPDLRAPELDFNVTGHSDDCTQLATLLRNKANISPGGVLDVVADIKGRIVNPQITGQINLDRLETSRATFEGLHLSSDYEDGRILINEFEARTDDGLLTLEGQTFWAGVNTNADVNFRWNGRIPGLTNSKPGVFSGTISGREGVFLVDANWNTPASELVIIKGYYSHTAESLHVETNLSQKVSRAAIAVAKITNHPQFTVQLDNPQAIARQFVNWDFWNKLDSLELTGDFSGPLEQLTSNIQIQHLKTASTLNLNGILGITSASWVDYKGSLSLQPRKGPHLEGRLDATWKDGTLTLGSLELDNAITASGSLNTLTGEIVSAELRLSSWPLSRGMAILSPQMEANWGANLLARLDVYGTIQHPEANFNLYASQGFFLDKGDFWVVLSADLKADTLRLTECNVGRGAISMLKADGNADLTTSELDFHLVSNLLDVSNVLQVFDDNPAKISGPLKLDAHISGTFQNPELELHAGMSYGRVFRIPFDSLSASLRFDPLQEKALILSEFRLQQKPDLTLEAQGILPFNAHPLDLHVHLNGNILKILHQLEPDILASRGSGDLELTIRQENGKIMVTEGSLDITEGYLKLPEVVEEIQSLRTSMKFHEGQLHIDDLSGEIEEQPFHIRNSFTEQALANYQRLYFPGANIDLGVLLMETNGKGIHAHIPDLMPNGTQGYLNLKGKDGAEAFTASGPIESPLFHGTIHVAGAVFTFPFPPGDGSQPSAFVRQVLAVLNSARWDVTLIPARDNRYAHEIKPVDENNFIGGVSGLIASVNIDINLDVAESKLTAVGSLDQGNFGFIGGLVSTRGTIEYLDLNFRVERFETQFDQSDILPWVQGRATTVYADSMGFSHNIYLKLYVVDPTSGQRHERGRWGDFVFILEDDIGSSQEQILAALGYSPGTVSSKVGSLGGTILSGVVLRSFIHPVERQLEHYLKLDIVRLQPTITQHLFESQILGIDPGPGPGPQSQIVWGAYFLRQSQLTIGKYLNDDTFLSYNGTWKTAINAANIREFGFLHRWNLDYRIRPVSGNLVLTLGYDYDNLEKYADQRLSLRYSFVFR
jgi:hypothetical protein